MLMFEQKMSSLKHSVCQNCRMCRLGLKIDNNGFCYGKESSTKCSTKRIDFLALNALPVWYSEDGTVNYDLPKCLVDLTHAEKMLIQRISPFVPFHHIKNGTFGITGHCCAFEQDVAGFVNSLPRKRNDVSMLHVMKSVASEIKSKDGGSTKMFRVRKQAVYDALIFLKKHNKEYKNVEIDMTALDWLNGQEGTIDTGALATQICETPKDDIIVDSGPCPSSQEEGGAVRAFGCIDEHADGVVSPGDAAIDSELKIAVDQSPSKSKIIVDWPMLSPNAVDEFSDMRIFVNAFPWLFPGGIGDPKDYPRSRGHLGEWGKHMLMFEDGRFARDKIFGFFALNHIIRMRNSGQGKFFIDSHHRNGPSTVSELKESIQRGDTSFINSLTYFNECIKGSSPYWFKKRQELHSWINYHVEAGNGPPTMFITLSCAELMWPDIIDAVRERMRLAGEDDSECYAGSPKLTAIMNDYAVVVQEVFQQRVITWLETVGKEVFGIKHYWVRYEFAPGRGQIQGYS